MAQGASREPLVTLTASVTLDPGQSNLVRLRWKLPAQPRDFCHLVGRLFDGNRAVDHIESGFVVSNHYTVASGPRLNYRDNYLRFGRRPLFLFGTDDWGYVFNTARETPLQWLRDMRQRRDLGVMIYENLQFGLPRSVHDQARRLRQVDGLVQLAQQYGQVYFPCLLCGYNVAVNDDDLARHTAFCRSFAARYARVPGLIYYLNGDLRCALSEAVTPHWNEFLRERYGTTENLRAAWRDQAPAAALGQIPADDFNDWGHAWDDLKVYDQNRFRAWLIRRWSSALIGGIRQHDRAHPTTAEFYQLPHHGVDIPAGIDGLDLSNFGYFDRPQADLARFPAISKFNDQRARGKSFGPGEYGVKTHPAWGDGQDYFYHITRTREQAIELFLAVAHYSLGLGASRIQNWCWKDDAHRVFPWGLVYPCDAVPKDIAYVHRNQSLLFRHFAPVDREPSVYLLTADSHRFGGGKWQVIEGILTGLDLALGTHVENLGTLNEVGLRIPKPARVIFYPLPFCPSDEVYATLLEWVRRGGVLYLSGDISYDEFRQRTRVRRLAELCGVRFVAPHYANISLNATNAEDQPCIQVESTGARVLRQTKNGAPLVVEHRVGRGRVVFNTDPVELHSVPARRAADLARYREVLQSAGVPPIGLEPNDPRLHLFRLPLRDGGLVYVLFNADASQPSRKVTLTDCRPPVTLTVARQRPALLWFDGRGALRAVETQGRCEAGGRLVVEDTTRGMLLSLDGKDLRQARAVLLMPLEPGTVRLQSGARWRSPTLETGEIQGGAWRTFEEASVAPTGGEVVVAVAADQVFSLLLLCEPADAPRWRRSLERAMTEPASLP